MALKVCLDCEDLHRNAGARCTPCASLKGKQRDAARGNRHERGLCYDHVKATAEVLADHPLCHWCGERPATTGDHVRQRVDGGSSTRDNYVASCAPCNYGRRGKIITPPEG